ncbi:MAG: nuclear transport factor 2 family protein [Actinomycetota bacterium]
MSAELQVVVAGERWTRERRYLSGLANRGTKGEANGASQCALARRFIQALDEQDVATIENLVAEDVVGHFPGDNKLSGNYKGRDQLFEMFAKGDEVTEGTFERELHDITASDDHIVVLVNLQAQRDGKVISWNAANVWHVSDGRLTEVWFFTEDQSATDEALA